MYIDSSLIHWIDSKGLDEIDIEQKLAAKLHEGGYVKDSYADAVIAREKKYPTGLMCDGLNAAIPHCDTEHVNSAAMCIGILSEPISWQRMDEPTEECPVQLVVMLALDEPHGQIESLQKVVGLLQHQDDMKEIIFGEDKQQTIELLLHYLD